LTGLNGGKKPCSRKFNAKILIYMPEPSVGGPDSQSGFKFALMATSSSLRFGDFLFPGILALMLTACWLGPRIWYSKTASDQPFVWFDERTNAPGWSCRTGETDKATEGQLAADSVFFGTFTRGASQKVRVFTAKRFRENPNEIGLFVHTPDRCWTEAGWQIEDQGADTVALVLDGVQVLAERRVFRHVDAGRELVYFFGLAGGQALPYRLDHNLGVGRRFVERRSIEKSGLAFRATDNRMWGRVWDAFRERRMLLGAKQLVRISTAIPDHDTGSAEALLQEAVHSLLVTRSLDMSRQP
jgi:hypothetical protein